MGSQVRSVAKPACIIGDRARTAHVTILRPTAAGNNSAAYSQIDSDSQTVHSPRVKTGTRCDGVCRWSSSTVSGRYSGIITSLNSAPACFKASHGRNDQEE
jgi:hypothetical protein